MQLKTRYSNIIMSEHIESISRRYSIQPYHEVTMTSGSKFLISPEELRKAFPDYK